MQFSSLGGRCQVSHEKPTTQTVDLRKPYRKLLNVETPRAADGESGLADYNWALETALTKYGIEIPFPNATCISGQENCRCGWMRRRERFLRRGQ